MQVVNPFDWSQTMIYSVNMLAVPAVVALAWGAVVVFLTEQKRR